jgi:hypothetical protein
MASVISTALQWADQSSYLHGRERAIYFFQRKWRKPATDKIGDPCKCPSIIPQMVRMQPQIMPFQRRCSVS